MHATIKKILNCIIFDLYLLNRSYDTFNNQIINNKKTLFKVTYYFFSND